MKSLFLIALILVSFGLAAAQTGQVPIVSREFGYQDWTHKNLEGEGKTNLREFAAGKKLVMVVYWMAWCPDWRLDASFVQQLHEKYGDKGLGIIGVGQYDTLGNMRAHVSRFGLTFPMVYESDSRAARDQTQHYRQRREAGDTRIWGTPLYVFLEPKALEPKSEVLSRNTDLVIGELRREDTERYIREKLGLADDAAPGSQSP
ncbi:MAG TPA: redoxin domain-containing protein [Pyrinomonadaceae bacterium]|nr:redoxin domain-containing protein [Pyrinomonadaceae bacterium]